MSDNGQFEKHALDRPDEVARLVVELGEDCAMVTMPESIVDAIISDHAKAALLDEAVKALGEYRSQFGQALEAHGIPFGATQEAAEEQARAILTRLRDVPVHDSKGDA